MFDQKLKPFERGGQIIHPGIISAVTPTHVSILLHRGRILTVRRTDDMDSMPVQQAMYAPLHHVFVKGLDGYVRPCGFRIHDFERVAPQPHDPTKDADVIGNPVEVTFNRGHNSNDTYVSSPPAPVPEYAKHSEPQARI